ncbi:alpha-(1,3)-fucosyltransferase 7 [Ambystoma mexicanum]|uniref:alpha-(1,3)-fucosyltransferase 7 n=1 Tax=Ambystoma mexicanum TaxID=8296 RepID=UPI0037E932EB
MDKKWLLPPAWALSVQEDWLRMPWHLRHHHLRTVGGMLMFAILAWNLKTFLYLSIVGKIHTSPPQPLTILVWSWPFHTPQNLSMDVCATRYSIPNCWLTINHSTFSQADVVVFHHKELVPGGLELLLEKKPPGQVWVWATIESPSHTRGLDALNHTFFNWTMTYRRDSEIFVPYGWLVPQNLHSFEIPNKTGLVAWVISHYKRVHARSVYFQKLSAHIKVDVYGRAAKKPLCSTCLLPTVSKYKFYLAFENSIHRDYITEKMWVNAFAAGAVPVVLGPPRANYEHFVPGDAFIHVDDFASPEELALFLKTMNSSRYREYFRWRENYRLTGYTDWVERFCSICSKYPRLPQGKAYRDVRGWFWDRGGQSLL